MGRRIAFDLDPAPAAIGVQPQFARATFCVDPLEAKVRPLGIAALACWAPLAGIAAVAEFTIGSQAAERAGEDLH